MNIYIENKSQKNIIADINGQSVFLKSGQSDIYEMCSERIKLSLTTDESYKADSISKKRGFDYSHHFVAVSDYEFECREDIIIYLHSEKSKGNNFDTYSGVFAVSEQILLPEPEYRMKDEDVVRAQFGQSKAKRKKIFDKVEKVERLPKPLKAVLTGIIWLIAHYDEIFIALFLIGLFIMIGITSSFEAAVKVYLFIGIIIGAIILVGKLFYNKFIKKHTKKVGKKVEQIMDKAFDAVDKKLTPSPDLPDIYVDSDSYFDSEYITAVFKYGVKEKQ